MSLSDKLQNLRKANGLSQEQLANQLYVSRQAISKWENGESIPDVENIIQLSKLFSVSTDYLLLDEITADQQPVNSAKSNVPAHMLGSAINAMGLVVVFSAYYSYQSLMIVSLGFIIQIAGISLYELLSYHHQSFPRLLFYCLNIWLIAPFPILFFLDQILPDYQIYYILQKLLHINLPYHPLLIPLLVYFACCIPLSFYLYRRHMKRC